LKIKILTNRRKNNVTYSKDHTSYQSDYFFRIWKDSLPRCVCAREISTENRSSWSKNTGKIYSI